MTLDFRIAVMPDERNIVARGPSGQRMGIVVEEDLDSRAVDALQVPLAGERR